MRAVFIGIDIFMHSVDSTDRLGSDNVVNELKVSVGFHWADRVTNLISPQMGEDL